MSASTEADPGYVEEMCRVLTAAYVDRGIEFHGRDELLSYLRGKGMVYLPEGLVAVCDNNVRKRLEAKGYTVCNPIAANGYLRSVTAAPEVKYASLKSRTRATKSRARRELTQERNFAEASEDPVIRATAKLHVGLHEAREVEERATHEFLSEIEEAIELKARRILDGE